MHVRRLSAGVVKSLGTCVKLRRLSTRVVLPWAQDTLSVNGKHCAQVAEGSAGV